MATDDQASFQGFIVFYAKEGYFLLENVAVLPNAAGRGVGKALISFCEDAARQYGVNAVHLYTNKKMTDNLSIYPRLGYQINQPLLVEPEVQSLEHLAERASISPISEPLVNG